MDFKNLINKIADNYIPTIKEMAAILELDEEKSQYLFRVADEVKKIYHGNYIHIRGIIEFSNYCRCLCKYCGLQADNNELIRYRMTPDEIVENTREAFEAGYKTIVLQSGEDMWYTREKISYIIRNIKKIGDIAITLSVGERDFDDYRQWKEDGADRFLIKQETADENLYNSLHPHSNFKNRIACLKELSRLGYQVGSGFMIGLPGQTTETIAKDIMLLGEIKAGMAGIGPFIPHKRTPLKEHPVGDGFMTLKAVALSRLLYKKMHLPVTTSLGVLSSEHKDIAFKVGANVIMQKVEPYKFRRLYEIYPKKIGDESTIKEERLRLEAYLKSLGLEIATDRGDAF
ncbi:biotin synthase [Fervidicella metallireducens AeB]|uniref:Biotin synthase n=1 Tax=Fervidicella metallireducens AeB TaxID=1403537 RepID=A0A017RU73_9CLOT|nr:[FeFe] hydrogenase H-cluster radical SAM maturase HydE [Fervidicella metallireducens]EYE88227.1 biotin synthase [Fervidicella metallireducens AeB]